MSTNSSTPRPNVETVQRLYDAFAQRDIPTIFGLFSPEIQLIQSTELPWGGTYSGFAGAREFFAKLTTTINSTLVIERYIDAGDHIIAIGRTQGTVNATGARYDVPIAHVWQLKEGKVVQVRYFIDNPTMLSSL